MRALVLALVALFHFSGVSWADETIVSGDSDHAYLPTDHQQEVMLHRFSFKALAFGPATHGAFGTTYDSKYGGLGAVNCVQMFGEQSNNGMQDTNRECTKAENAFRASRGFRLTRLLLHTGAAGTFQASGSWTQAAMRVISIQPNGTVAEIGAEQAYASANGLVTSWSLDTKIPAGVGVGLQMRALSVVTYELIGSFPTVELWGIWE